MISSWVLVASAMLPRIWVMDGQDCPPMPVPRAGYIAGVISGKLVVAGGSYWKDGKVITSARTDSFDPKHNRWEAGPELPGPRSNGGSAVYHEDLYSFGGVNGGAALRETVRLHNGVWQMAPEAALPESRMYPLTVVLEDAIYVLGGLARAGDYATASNKLWRWQPEIGWKELPPLPGPPRFIAACVAHQGKLFVFGGATVDNQSVRNLDDAYVYDPGPVQWKWLGKLPMARRAWWAVSVKTGILLLGGYSQDFSAEIYEYEPDSRQIRKVGTLPHALADAKFFAIGDRLWVAGGETQPKVRSPWTFDLKLSRGEP